MEPIQKQKKKKEEEGFDALQARFLEEGLVAASDNRTMGLRAIGQTHSIAEKHHTEKQQKRDSEFKAKVKKEHREAVKSKLGRFAKLTPVKLKPRHGYMPHQLKDRGGSDSSKEGSGSGKKA